MDIGARRKVVTVLSNPTGNTSQWNQNTVPLVDPKIMAPKLPVLQQVVSDKPANASISLFQQDLRGAKVAKSNDRQIETLAFCLSYFLTSINNCGGYHQPTATRIDDRTKSHGVASHCDTRRAA